MSRAGKTTYSRQFHNVIHLDSFGRLYESYDKVMKHLAEKSDDKDIIIEGIYDTAEKRTELLNVCNCSSKKTCIWLDTPWETIQKRFMIAKPKYHDFEPPTLNEGWDEIIIIRGENNYVYTNEL